MESERLMPLDFWTFRCLNMDSAIDGIARALSPSILALISQQRAILEDLPSLLFIACCILLSYFHELRGECP